MKVKSLKVAENEAIKHYDNPVRIYPNIQRLEKYFDFNHLRLNILTGEKIEVKREQMDLYKDPFYLFTPDWFKTDIIEDINKLIPLLDEKIHDDMVFLANYLQDITEHYIRGFELNKETQKIEPILVDDNYKGVGKDDTYVIANKLHQELRAEVIELKKLQDFIHSISDKENNGEHGYVLLDFGGTNTVKIKHPKMVNVIYSLIKSHYCSKEYLEKTSKIDVEKIKKSRVDLEVTYRKELCTSLYKYLKNEVVGLNKVKEKSIHVTIGRILVFGGLFPYEDDYHGLIGLQESYQNYEDYLRQQVKNSILKK